MNSLSALHVSCQNHEILCDYLCDWNFPSGYGFATNCDFSKNHGDSTDYFSSNNLNHGASCGTTYKRQDAPIDIRSDLLQSDRSGNGLLEFDKIFHVKIRIDQLHRGKLGIPTRPSWRLEHRLEHQLAGGHCMVYSPSSIVKSPKSLSNRSTTAKPSRTEVLKFHTIGLAVTAKDAR